MTYWSSLLYIDNLSLLMCVLVAFVGVSVLSYSSRFLEGDRNKKSFAFNITLLMISVFFMVCADNLILFLFAWTIANAFLSTLILHKKEWRAAAHSAKLAKNNFLLGSLFLALGFLSLLFATNTTSIQAILNQTTQPNWTFAGTLFLFLGAATQSGLWPFQKWLISSLNAPTPVSAMMHAGLVNGGGFLIARFAPLFLSQPLILNILLMLGTVTALIGTLWKLMQSDYKRMLACSTMGQMGFMMIQCGLGLIPSAIAHLIWHGLFKAYLFLSSGSAAEENRLDLNYPPTIQEFLAAMVCGSGAAWLFSYASNKQLLSFDTNLVLIVLAFMAGTQAALSLIRGKTRTSYVSALFITTLFGWIYGLNIQAISYVLTSLKLSQPQPLNLLHGVVLAVLTISWLALVFRNPKTQNTSLKLYVQLLNASQPDAKTITACRTHYRF